MYLFNVCMQKLHFDRHSRFWYASNAVLIAFSPSELRLYRVNSLSDVVTLSGFVAKLAKSLVGSRCQGVN